MTATLMDVKHHGMEIEIIYSLGKGSTFSTKVYLQF